MNNHSVKVLQYSGDVKRKCRDFELSFINNFSQKSVLVRIAQAPRHDMCWHLYEENVVQERMKNL